MYLFSLTNIKNIQSSFFLLANSLASRGRQRTLEHKVIQQEEIKERKKKKGNKKKKKVGSI